MSTNHKQIIYYCTLFNDDVAYEKMNRAVSYRDRKTCFRFVKVLKVRE